MLLQDRLYLSNAWPVNPPGILSGIRQIDDNLGGLQPGELHAMGAPHGIGATSLLLKCAINAARHTAVVVATTAAGTDVVEQMIRLQFGFARGSVRVRASTSDEMFGHVLRHPVEIVDRVSDLDQLRSRIDFTLDDLQKQGCNPSLLVIDCPDIAAPNYVDTNPCRQPSLREVAKSRNIAVMVNIRLPILTDQERAEHHEIMKARPGYYFEDPEWRPEPPYPEDLDVWMELERGLYEAENIPSYGNRMLVVFRHRDQMFSTIPFQITPEAGICEEKEDIAIQIVREMDFDELPPDA
jgi:hypothetical protein